MPLRASGFSTPLLSTVPSSRTVEVIVGLPAKISVFSGELSLCTSTNSPLGNCSIVPLS